MNAKIFNIYKEYENFTLDVSEMELPCNKIIGLVGKNGAGKTTLLKLLYGLVYSENLKIKIDQQDCSIENPLWKSKLFFSPETNVIPHMFKAKDVAKFYERFYSNWNSDEFYSYLKVIGKELLTSFIVGLMVAIVNCLWIYLLGSTNIIDLSASNIAPFKLGLIVGASMLVCIIVAKLIGSLIPLLCKLCKIDPALLAGPMVTTLVDATSIIIYFLIATKLFGLI